MVMKSLRKSASGGLGKFILFGFLALAVGGLVMMDMGGFFRGGVSRSDVAKVGGEKIGISSFDRTVRRTLSRLGIPPQEAYRAGYIRQLLIQDIRDRLLSQSAEKTGILISDEHVTNQIKELIKPMVGPGQSPGDVLQRLLMNQGMSESEFIGTIKKDTANTLLVNALQGGFESVPDNQALDLYRHQLETRAVDYIVFSDESITDVPDPTEDELHTLHNMLKENYAQPELRTFKILKIKDDSLRKTLDITDEEIRETYENDIDLYTVKETLTLEQALFTNEEHATAVYQAVKNKTSFKKAVKEITGSETAWLGEKTLEEDSLMEELKEPITAVDQPDTLLAPLSSPLGWHVIRIKSINPERTKPFEEVREDIREELTDTRLMDERYAMSNTVDDLLASGALPEEVAEEVDLEITELPPVTRYGYGEDGKNIFENKQDIGQTVLQTGFLLEDGETSTVMEMPDGSFMAVHLAVSTPKTYKPFESVKDDLAKRWDRDQRRAENRLRVMDHISALKGGTSDLAALSKQEKQPLRTKESLSRTDQLDAPLGGRFVQTAFAQALNTPFMVEGETGIIVGVVKDVKWPETIDPEDETFKSFKANLTQTLKTEALMHYLEQYRKKVGVQVNAALLDRIYGSEPESY